MQNGTSRQQVLFQLDSYFSQRPQPFKCHKQICELLVSSCVAQIKNEALKLDIQIIKMKPYVDKATISHGKYPNVSIWIQFQGITNNMHEFYLMIEAKVNQFIGPAVEIKDQKFIEEKMDNIEEVFKGTAYENKVFRLAKDYIFVTDSNLKLEQIKDKLKFNQWTIAEFTPHQIYLTKSQERKGNLKDHMKYKKIYYESLQFQQTQIKITSDESNMLRFTTELREFLQSFKMERQECIGFNDCLMVGMFKKYYQKKMQEKYVATFEVGENYLVRNNYTKLTDDILQQLKLIREKIRKKKVIFVSLTPIKSDAFFVQNKNSIGYFHSQLGSKLIQMQNVKITLRPIETIKKQKQLIGYILNDELSDNSIVYEIIKNNGIFYAGFLSEVHRKKNPTRLRLYITQNCSYAANTCLLHSGREGASLTLRKDLDDLFSIFKNKITLAILKHNQSFINNTIGLVLDHIAMTAASIHENSAQSVDFSINSMNLNRKQFLQVELYYEGGQNELVRLQNLLSDPYFRAKTISNFNLEQFDFQKISALNYLKFQAKGQNSTIRLSPILGEIYDYELKRAPKPSKGTKRVVFSTFSIQCEKPNQLVQFVINTKTKSNFRITHQKNCPKFSKRPYIQKMQQIEPQLLCIVDLIIKYFGNCQYILISANCKSDGIHGRSIEYCEHYYMGQQDKNELKQIKLNLTENTIVNSSKEPIRCRIKQNYPEEWYEIVTHADEFEQVLKNL